MPDPSHDNTPSTPEGVLRDNLDITDCINEMCPWSGKPVQADSLTEYDGNVVGFCNPGCRDQFESAVRHFEQAKASQAAR
jgi:YHS domain-containing protein